MNFTAENTGNVTLSDVEITDPLVGLSSLECQLESASVTQPVILSPGQILDCSATYTITQADLDSGGVTNTATVNAVDPDDESVIDTANVTISAGQTPALRLEKVATQIVAADESILTKYETVGDRIDYTYTLTNIGNVTLFAPFTVTDDLITSIDCATPPATLAPLDTYECTASYTVTQEDLDSGSVVNIATATAMDAETSGVVVESGEATEEVLADQNPSVVLTKTATLINGLTPDPFIFNNVGDEITYAFTIENTGNLTFTDLRIIDTLVQVQGSPIDLAPGEVDTSNFSATYTITQEDIDTGVVNNTAWVLWTDDPTDINIYSQVSESVPGSQTPALELTKTATLINSTTPDPLVYSAVGDVITYSFSVENIGNVALTSVNITDALTGSSNLAVSPTSLDPGQTGTVTATYTVTQDDIDTGSITNTATAYGTFAGTQYSDTDGTTVSGTQTPALELTKTATLINSTTPDPLVYSAVGDVITYSFSVENIGNVALTSVNITDALTGSSNLAVSPTSLDPGQTGTVTATYTVTQDDIDTGSITNTATAYGTFDGTQYSDTDGTTVSGTQTPALELTKTATLINSTTPDPLVYSAVGDVITYSFSVENIGNVALTSVNITDALTGSSNLAVSPTSLDPGQTGTVTATYTVTQDDIDTGSITNTATAYGTFAGTQYSDTDGTTVSGTQTPALELTKTATLINSTTPDPLVYSAVGDVITYSFSVENIGNVALTSVNITDALTGSSNLAVSPTSLDPGQTGTVTATYTVTQDDIDTGSITNTATAYGTFDGTQYSDTDGTTVSGTQTPALELTKTATLINSTTPDPLVYSAVGDVITYSFSVENIGNVALTSVNITDALTGSSNLAVSPTSLDPGQTGTVTATYTVTQDDIDTGSITNTATAYGTFAGTQYSDTDGTTVSGTQTPALELTKTATLINSTTPDPLVYSAVGDVITYSFSVENIGNVALTSVNITDALTGSSNLAVSPTSLDPGQTGTVTATYTVTQDDIDTGSITNTATAYGTFAGTQYSDTDGTTVSGTQTPALELTKTATLINSTTPDPLVYSAVGDVITYSFSVENIGNVALTSVNITDALTGSSNLAVSPTSLDPGQTGTVTATYTVTQDDIDTGSITNTATAYGTFDGTQYSDTDGTTVSGSQTTSLKSYRIASEDNPSTSKKVVALITPDLISDLSPRSAGNVKAINNSQAELTRLRLSEQPKTRKSQEVDPPVVNSYVTKIILNGNNLIGSLPSLLGDLSLLEEVELMNNHLSGIIPTNIGSLIYLKKLVLYKNQLIGSIPAGIGQLTKLDILDLGFNQLSGTIPTQIVNLVALTQLYLDSNQLTGSIPGQIGNLTNLQYFRLNQNNLEGELPETLGNLTQLIWLNIHSNNLSGHIPMSLIQITNLAFFTFYTTSLCEPLNQDFINWKATVTNWIGTGTYCILDKDAYSVFLPLIFR